MAAQLHYRHSSSRSNQLFVLLIGFLLFLAPLSSRAYMIVLDLDASTVPTPPKTGPLLGPPSPANGFESAISVTSGSPVTVTAYVVFITGTVVFDHIGLDFNWGLSTDTATLMPTTAPLAGTLSSDFFYGPFLSISRDLTTAIPVTDGDALIPLSPGLAALPGFTSNIGGAGYYDPAVGSAGPFGQFQGFGGPTPPAPLSYVDLWGMTFTATGSPGDVVTIDPSGIFEPGTGAPSMLPTLISGGEGLFDSVGGTVYTGSYVTGNTITISIPEPGAGLLGLLGVGTLLTRRRRSL